MATNPVVDHVPKSSETISVTILIIEIETEKDFILLPISCSGEGKEECVKSCGGGLGRGE